MSAGPGAVSGPAERRGTEEPPAVAGAPPGAVPGPAQGPAVPILVYDGDCVFCTRWAQLAERLGTSAEAVPWQGIDLGDALDVTAGPAQHEVLWVAPDGQVYGGSRAVAHLLMDVGGPWRLVGPVSCASRIVPGSAASTMYRARPGGSCTNSDSSICSDHRVMS